MHEKAEEAGKLHKYDKLHKFMIMSPSSKTPSKPIQCGCHQFNEHQITLIRQHLLSWYDREKRDLPWRTLACTEKDPNVRGYAVWVSEVMLQQTQVSTVTDYFHRWLERWPDVSALSRANLEEVHQVWAGLGYYSRATRLHEGSKIVCDRFKGQFPSSSDQLMKEMPGVGRYTASAVASIAFNERTGVVDGNVIRLLSRMRRIGADSTSKPVIDTLWSLANALVNKDRPGDFNQAMMELGATVCTPKNPSCSSCPVSDYCLAFQQAQLIKNDCKRNLIESIKVEKDIEDLIEDCKLCFESSTSYKTELGVMNYPQKGKKIKVREATSLVCLVFEPKDKKYLLLRRPKTGLLANLLEFPSFELDTKENKVSVKKIKECLSSLAVTELTEQPISLGEVVHQFSHIRQTYLVWKVNIANQCEISLNDTTHQNYRWLIQEEIECSAISTAMKKVFHLITKNAQPSKKRKASSSLPGKEQKKITSFFSRN